MSRTKKTILVIGALFLPVSILGIIKTINFVTGPMNIRKDIAARTQECGTAPIIVHKSTSSFGGGQKLYVAYTPSNPSYETWIKQYERLKNPGIALFTWFFGASDSIVGIVCSLGEAKLLEREPGFSYLEHPQNTAKQQ